MSEPPEPHERRKPREPNGRSGPLPAVEVREPSVVLRRLTLSDVPDIVRACQDPTTQRWTTIPVPYREEHAVSFVQDYSAKGWQSGELACFAVQEPGSPRYCGAIDLRLDGKGMAEVGYAIAPWARGRGLGTAALRAISRYGFSTLGLARIEWQAEVGNWPSRRMAERVGFTVEGTCRQRLVSRGTRRDGWIGGLLPSELR